jgi:hypothetical protein
MSNYLYGRLWDVYPTTLLPDQEYYGYPPPLPSPPPVITHLSSDRGLGSVLVGGMGSWYVWAESGGVVFQVPVCEYVYTPRTANLDFGSGAFTLSARVYRAELSDGDTFSMITFRQSAGTYMSLYLRRTGVVYSLGFVIYVSYVAGFGEFDLASPTGLFKVIRNGSHHYMYQDGTLLGDANFNRDPEFSSGYVRVGDHSNASNIIDMNLNVSAGLLVYGVSRRDGIFL